MDPSRALTHATKQWMDLDDLVERRRTELKPLLQQRKDAEAQLGSLMAQLKIDNIKLNSSGNVLRQKVSSNMVPVNRAHVEQVLSKYLAGVRHEELVQTLVQAIFQTDRPKVEKLVLKRCKQ